MAKLVFGLNQSLDGYVDHLAFRPSPALFRHFIERVRDLTGTSGDESTGVGDGDGADISAVY
jgi:hypothetical protein